ncbi:hypothetical protein [Spirosoma fluviale]|uniref:Beta-lactamase-inhibitor-like, PepSY-like n=1 Tax=Spirosoma fluviale TaxID=1597977 RepID=A0A286GC40_9BACT|nr:hypothetical protein [Spirosoma fluviale]SOD93058.1 hypothetical protein SAMN06269250_4332 [Spirosoma fluviale]
MKTILALAFTFLVLPCFGQQKYEREYRIKSGAVPQKAARFINEVFNQTTIHWYGEESLTGTTIEAKLKSGGKRYSIEFDLSGKIQDVEIQRRFNQIPAQTRKTLSEGLNQKFDRFSVVKTQLQWTASQDDLKTAILTDKLPSSVQIRYELILKARKNRSANYYEVLCEQNGAIVSIHQLVQRNTNNLIY